MSNRLVLWRRYSLLLWSSALPLLLLVAGLGIYQFQIQKEAALRGLEQRLAQQTLTLDSLVKRADDHIEQLRRQAEELLGGETPRTASPLRALLGPDRRPTGGDSVEGLFLDAAADTPLAGRIGSLLALPDAIGRRGTGDGEIDMALQLFAPMRLAQQVTPYLRWSYYFSASEDLIAIYPFRPSRYFIEEQGFTDLTRVMESWFDYDIFLDATPERNPGRRGYWTGVYQDAAGAGWMVSHGAPVYRGGVFMGIVGTDILLDFLDTFLARDEGPPGRTWIVNPALEVVADSLPAPFRGDRAPSLADLLPRELAGSDPRALLEPTEHRELGGYHLVARPIATSPWTMVHLVSNDEVNGLILGRFVPYVVILAGLALTVLLAHEILRRQFVRPALQLVEHIRAESGGQPAPPPDLPRAWQPWLDRVQSAFADQRHALERLKASEERFLAAAESLPDGLAIFDAEDRIAFYNSRYPHHLAPSLRSVLAIGKRFEDWIREGLARGPIYHPEMGEDFPRRRFEMRRQERSEHEHRLIDGRWVRIRESRMADGGRVLLTSDVTERRHAEQTLLENEARYRAVVETQTEFVVRQSPKGHITFANGAYCRYLGMSWEELTAPEWDDFSTIVPEDRQRHADHLAGLSPKQPTATIELRGRLSDGTVRWEQWTDTGIFDADGRLVETQSVGRDITEAKQAETALMDSEARYRAVVETQTEFVVRHTPEDIITFANGAFCRHLGLARELLVGANWNDLNPLLPEDDRRHRDHVANLTLAHPNATIELRSILPIGTICWEQWTNTGLFDAEGRLVEMQAVGRDITEVKRAERALIESEARFRAIADGVPLPVTIAAAERPEILFVNSRAAEILGLAEGDGEERIATIWNDFDERARLVRSTRQIGKVDGYEAELRHADGSPFTALISATLIDHAGEPAIMTALADISEQRRLAEALRASEERLAAFMQHAPVGMYVKDLDGHYVMANPEMAKVFGRPVEQVLGLSGSDLFGAEDAQVIAGFDAEVVRGGRTTVHEEHFAGLTDYQWSLVIRFPIRDAQGAITNIAGFDVDISRQKQAEEELTQQREAVHQAEKLTALGSLLAGVAHELNNPLSIVAGYASMLRDFAADDGVRSKAERIRAAADRCAKIVRTFLAMARSQPREHGRVEINQLLDACLEMLGYGLRSADVEVARDFDQEGPAVWGDGDQLHQVFANLILNAQQALQGSAPPRRLTLRSRLRDGLAIVEVEDSGPGIASEIRARVFDPFFTTKPTGLGTGLGLSVSRGIVLAHEGRLEIAERSGPGACLIVSLPASDRTDDGEEALLPTSSVRPARILVVDDEPDLCKLLQETLGADGHGVETASSGREAIQRLERDGFDLIISDLRMPDLDGPALHAYLARYRPELAGRLIFITGDVLGGGQEGAAIAESIPLIEKPIQLEEMRRRIAMLLAPRTAAGQSSPEGSES